jgi:uncharacterized protein (DUF1330 family)
MTHEMLVGLHVTDEASYQAYREAMTPMLAACGGGFRYDFRVGETLRSETAEPITRLFTIHFPDSEAANAFFDDPDYQAVRRLHFEGAVAATTILATYDR